MRVRIFIVVIFFLIALLASIGGTTYYYIKTLESVQQATYNHLETVVQSRAHHIETFLDDKKILAENLALIGKVETLLLTSKSDSDYNAKKIAVEERLQKTIDSVEEIKSIGVIDENNILIASTDSELVGRDYSESIFFKENPERESMIQFNDDSDLGIVLGVVSPIKDDSGKYLGMLGIITGFEQLNKIVSDKTGIGETGETYLINKDFYAITPLLFEKDAILEFKVYSTNSINCLGMLNILPVEEHIGHEAVEIFLDYRGKKVIGTHHPLYSVDWCFLAEIDEEEILWAQRELFQRITLMLIIVITTIITLVGFFVGRHLEKDVVLKKGKKKI